jgi:hypothetical protein
MTARGVDVCTCYGWWLVVVVILVTAGPQYDGKKKKTHTESKTWREVEVGRFVARSWWGRAHPLSTAHPPSALAL